jgi:hypothetical protein
VIFSVSSIGLLTYRSFMSNVAILWFSFTLIVGILHARLSEFCVFYLFSSCSCCLSMFSFFAILYVGAFLLLITGLIGLSGLCIFIHAFSLGGIGFFCVRCLICSLVNIQHSRPGGHNEPSTTRDQRLHVQLRSS